MIKHANPKTFIDKLKAEEQQLLKERNTFKPKPSDISDLSDKIYIQSSRDISDFNILAFAEGV